jgi:hypothetical protein
MIFDLIIKLLATAFMTAVLSFWGLILIVIVYWIIYWILKLLS